MMAGRTAALAAHARELRVFLILWVGQTVSAFGGVMVGFAMGVWVFQRTGSATAFSLILLFGLVPGIIATPFAGALVDRMDRRRVLILSTSAAAASSLFLAAVIQFDRMALWHIYLSVSVGSVSGAFARPAFAAAVTLLVPRSQFARASGMVQTGQAAAQVAAPVLAGVLVVTLGLQGVILINLGTFAVALTTLAIVRFPPAPVSEAGRSGGSLWRDAVAGWAFVAARRGLVGLLVFFAASNLAIGFMQALLTPMILGFSTPEVLGLLLSASGAGMLVGGVVMSVWGGPAQRIHGVLGFGLAFGVGMALLGVRPSPVLVGAALFASSFCVPFVNGCNTAIWQSKVPPDLQGRVFAMRVMVAWSSAPIAFILAGPLADRAMEPLLAPGGALAAALRPLVGEGDGRGAALLIVVMGVLLAANAAAGYLYGPLRRVEAELPDAVGETPSAPVPDSPPAPEPVRPRSPALR